MADNQTIFNSGGTPFDASADDVTVTGTGGAAKVQYVKLVDGTNGGTEPIAGNAANGLDVDVTRLIPGTTDTALGKAEDAPHTSGDVGVMMLAVRDYTGAGADADYSALSVSDTGELRTYGHHDVLRIAVNSGGLTTTATAYAAGDQVGTQFTFANASRLTGGTGYVVGAQLTSAADTTGPFDLVITRSSITLAADNAAYAISDADALAVIAVIQMTGAMDLGNNRIAQAFNLSIPYDCSGGTSLFGSLITRGAIAATPFANATDIQMTLWVERN